MGKTMWSFWLYLFSIKYYFPSKFFISIGRSYHAEIVNVVRIRTFEEFMWNIEQLIFVIYYEIRFLLNKNFNFF